MKAEEFSVWFAGVARGQTLAAHLTDKNRA